MNKAIEYPSQFMSIKQLLPFSADVLIEIFHSEMKRSKILLVSEHLDEIFLKHIFTLFTVRETDICKQQMAQKKK